MNSPVQITPIFNEHVNQIAALILPIQQIEFNVPITLEAQPDLLDIESFYHKNGGCFWGAIIEGEVVGTIALIAAGHETGAVRKMFVKKEFRGKELGIAQSLLETLLAYSRKKEICHLYLGTVDVLKASHRFYERNNFTRVNAEELPVYFPRMAVDTIFYQLELEGQYQEVRIVNE